MLLNFMPFNDQLEQARELSGGQEKPLSTTDQRLLLRTWFTHLLHERYLDTAGSGIEETLSRIGVPKQRAAQLIFLACLGFQDVESLLLQRDLGRNMEYFQEINRLLLLSGHAFRQQYARSRESRQLVENFATKARTFLHGERDRFLDQILDAPWADQPIYLAMDAFFSQRTYLWHWNLESEIADDANPPGPKGTTGGASAE